MTTPDVNVGALRELFRYHKANRTRAYGLKALSDDHAELWVVSRGRGMRSRARRLLTFAADVQAAVLEDITQELRRGGWSPA